MVIVRLTLLLASFLLPGLAISATPSVEDFVKHSLYSGVKISPTGEFLAVTVDRGDQDVLTILRTRDLKLLKVNQLPDKKSVGSFHWVGDDRLMFNAVKKMGGYAQPFPTGEWFAVNADGSKPRSLIFYGSQGTTGRNKTVGNQRFSLLDVLRDSDRSVIMEVRTPRSKEGAGTEVVRMDTMTGRRFSLGRAPKENCSIVLDANKEPRYAVCYSSRDEEGEYDERTELYRREDSGQWALVSASKSDGYHLSVVRTTRNGTVYVLRGDDKTPAAIGTLDTATGDFNLLFQDPVADISRFIWSTDEQTLIGVVTEAGAPKVTLIDEDHADATLYTSLAASFPNEMVDLSSNTYDGNRVVVSVYSDSNPGELYLFDRTTGKARFLMQGRQWLDKKQMASILPFVFASKDGTQVHAYLTLPHGSDGKNLPLIVNPHGGPIGPRDNWGFNPETQLFASRGYASLQINFRGSGGYGKGFQDAGHGQWGEAIQDDIIAATQWVIEKGYADPHRICIYGGSFGGYSALMAPIRAPGLFQCAFGYVGVYDMAMLYDRGDIPESASGKRYLRRTIGTDKDVLARNSPTERAAEVKVPVFLAAGARDRRAVPEQTEAMNKALIAAGNKPEGMIIQSGEMHGFYDQDNRVNLYTQMLEFFNRHIGANARNNGS